MKNELIEKRISQDSTENQISTFNRRTWNEDSQSCWINSILQLLLTGFDHSSNQVEMWSELGKQLLVSQTETITHPQIYKQILQNQINLSSQHQERQNILTGYQGARHFLNIISDLSDNWPDVYNFFLHTTRQSITCLSCQYESIFDATAHLYHEMQVPPNGSKLKNFVQHSFENKTNVDDYRCINNCDGSKIKQDKFISSFSSSHIIIVLSQTENTFNNNVSFTEDFTIIDHLDTPLTYEFMAVVQFHENMQHYTCDVKSQADGKFYHTNDSRPPKLLNKSEVTKKGFVVLYRKKDG